MGGEEGGGVVGRLAPSPTGVLHLGNVRTFMMAWLAVRSAGGRMILRVEDLEKPLTGTILEDMLSDLSWLGFDWDEGPVWTGAEDETLVEIRRFPRARALAAGRARDLVVPDRDGWASAIGRLLPYAGGQGPYIQSRRTAWYNRVFGSMCEAGLIYPCTCERAEYAGMLGAPHEGDAEPRYPGTCRDRWPSVEAAREWLGRQEAAGAGFSNAPVRRNREPVWRFRVPDDGSARVEFRDAIHGICRIDVSATVGDFVVFKSPGLPAYQLAVVADDLAMGVTQVVRGDDLISSTARQILLWKALEALGLAGVGSGALASGRPGLPEYAHVPLVVGPDGARLAKRHGDARLRTFRDQGGDPCNLIGRLAAWSGLGDGSPCSLADLVGQFDWRKLSRDRLILDDDVLKQFKMH